MLNSNRESKISQILFSSPVLWHNWKKSISWFAITNFETNKPIKFFLWSVQTASPHQNWIETQNQDFQRNAWNMWSRKPKKTFKYCFFMLFYNALQTFGKIPENVLWWMPKANIIFENVLWWIRKTYCLL